MNSSCCYLLLFYLIMFMIKAVKAVLTDTGTIYLYIFMYIISMYIFPKENGCSF